MLDSQEPPLRVISLHDLLYCERLFYFTEVENIQNPTSLIYAGRRLHDDVVPLDDETPERRSMEVASETWGLLGKIDAVRKRDGNWIAYEHKRGRCCRGPDKEPLAWPSDRIQAIAYAVLLEERLGEPVSESRVRYHADNVTAIIAVDGQARQQLTQVIARAIELRQTTARPPVTDNENLCRRCSLAPVCLSEEERLALVETIADDTADPQSATSSEMTVVARSRIPTLFPSNRERTTLHITSPKAYVGRSGESLNVTTEDESHTKRTQKVPIEQIDALVVHGFGQVTTQAIHLCASRGVAVQWLTAGGKFAAGISASPGRVQQRLRQYAALGETDTRLRLARMLVHAKVEMQLRYLLRATRGDKIVRVECRTDIERMRESLRQVDTTASDASLRGLEGQAAKAYFSCLPKILSSQVPSEMRPHGRTKHPPRDRFNCLLSFGYSLIFTAVHRGALAVGLEPAFGFYHVPRSAAPPLVMDVMELFRTSLWEMPLIGSINRMQWDIAADFVCSPGQVWLTDSGRKKAISLFEERLEQSHRHPHTGQSLTYSRMIELELRLLEKEWTGCPGMFAQLRLR